MIKDEDIDNMSDRTVVDYIQGNTRLNRARKEFSSHSAKIATAQCQRKPLGPIEMRRMELKAVLAIIKEFGIIPNV